MGNAGMFSLIQWQQDIFGLLKEVQVDALEIRSPSQSHAGYTLLVPAESSTIIIKFAQFNKIRIAILGGITLSTRVGERVST